MEQKVACNQFSVPFQKNDRLLFIGDSITEADKENDPEGLGFGYVRFIYEFLQKTDSSKQVRVINRGVSGNRIIDLQRRWEKDVIEEQPDWVSVSIGVNDVWRQLDRPELEQVTPERFEAVYRELLVELDRNTHAKVILMEPTIIGERIDSPGNRLLSRYVEIVRQVSQDFSAVLVPTHEAFRKFLQKNRGEKLTTDGVHMNAKGNRLMAQTWMKAIMN